ncbi:MAG: sigma 54-interacting transcriptional regulator [Myxococcaceae bacterium]|nr:sigma 54-interacting transcriptional regulator [Myxococcaceae bacterium]
MSEGLDWKGTPPQGPLAAAIGALGLERGKSPARIRVVRTAKAEVPPAPRGLEPWVWVCDVELGGGQVLQAVERGAHDACTLASPAGRDRLVRRLRELLFEVSAPTIPAGVVAKSPVTRALLAQVSRAAKTSMPVLITGETGTGKEVAARLLHQWSPRSRKTFVPINCAAIPNELMEGELFGYTKGAFSGAVKDYDGLILAAEGGTVFLDEIDDTPHSLQVKLLRVLEDRVVSRLGESVWHQVDFRLVAATNRDLRVLIEQGTFGADLFERLSVLSLELPPLRARREDIPHLVEHFITQFYAQETTASRGQVRTVTDEAMELLVQWRWPGNIRELRNVIASALVQKTAGEELLPSDLPRRLIRREAPQVVGAVVDVAEVARRVAAGTMNLKQEREALERAALEEALRRAGGNAAEAARLLGEVGRGKARDPGGTVRTMMARLGLKTRGDAR